MRLDKYLKVSRIIKRRTVANEAAGAGRVSVNGKVAKPSAEVKEGDTLDILLGGKHLLLRIESVKESVRKEDAANMYTVLSGDADQ
jgi:ribosomal 50S subunit-recycling heat shock protein